MKKVLVNYGGIFFFYIIIVLGVISLCSGTPAGTTKSSSFGMSAAYKN
ncbi:MAG: hypothetical protein IJO63_02670 [Bacilli bacterium]|nr:hypothetical protein [Bacilli bacterium]